MINEVPLDERKRIHDEQFLQNIKSVLAQMGQIEAEPVSHVTKLDEVMKLHRYTQNPRECCIVKN